MSADAMASEPRDARCDAKNGALAAFSPRARQKRRGRRSKTPADTFEDAALPRFRSCGALFLSSKARLRNNAGGDQAATPPRGVSFRFEPSVDENH